jgi:hypothetical protein
VTVAETILVFAGIPLVIIAILAALTLRPAKGQKRLRYKPGQSWDYAPIWYEPHPDGLGPGHGASDLHAAIAGGSRSMSGGPLGGARGTW